MLSRAEFDKLKHELIVEFAVFSHLPAASKEKLWNLVNDYEFYCKMLTRVAEVAGDTSAEMAKLDKNSELYNVLLAIHSYIHAMGLALELAYNNIIPREATPMPIFNEDTLRAEIAAKWGPSGAHMDVYNTITNRLEISNSLLQEVSECLAAGGITTNNAAAGAVMDRVNSYVKNIVKNGKAGVKVE